MVALAVVDGRVIRVAGKPRAPSLRTTTFIVVLCFVVSSGTCEFEIFVSSWQVVLLRYEGRVKLSLWCLGPSSHLIAAFG